MKDLQNKGRELLLLVIWRSTFVTFPAAFITKYINGAFKNMNFAKINAADFLFVELLAAVFLLVAIVAMFKPRLLIKPLVGAGLILMAREQIATIGEFGRYSVYIHTLMYFGAFGASFYLMTYDFMQLIFRLIHSFRKKFSKIQKPNFDGPFASTTAKGDALENYVVEIYRRIYGNATKTGKGGDQGADVSVRLKNDRKLIIQCKNTAEPINNKAIQEIMAARAHYNADELAVVCPKGFTKGCKELAASQSDFYGVKIHLLDEAGLEKLTEMANGERMAA